MTKKLALLMLALLLCVFAASAWADTLTLPASLKFIEEDAFAGDTAITQVTLPEGMESIGDRAFQGCANLEEIYIPDSVWYIGEDAIPSQARIRCYIGSYAWQYAQGKGREVALEKRWKIETAEAGDTAVNAYVTTADACTLLVEALEDGGETVLQTATADCGEWLWNEYIGVTLNEALPEYFSVRLTLLDAAGSALCEPYLYSNPKPYDPHDDFEKKTPGSFATGAVLDYGSRGFAVLQDGVRQVSGSESGGVYTVQSQEAVQAGDALYITGLNAVVKAASVTDNGDGSYTVTPDGDAALKDFYQYINYHGEMDGAEALEGTEYGQYVQSPRDGGQGGKLFSRIISTVDYTAKTNLHIIVSTAFRYDFDLFGPDYLEAKAVVTAQGTLTFAAGKAYEHEWEIPLFTCMAPTQVPGVLVDLTLTLPIKVQAAAQGEVVFGVTSKNGFTYNTYDGMTPVKDFDAYYDMNIKGEISCKIGPRITVGVSFLRIISANVGVQTGLEFKAAACKDLSDGHTSQEDPEDIHACDLCFEGTIDWYLDLVANIKLIRKNLWQDEWKLTGKNLFTGYISMVSDPEGVHHGQPAMGTGKCPNRKYRLNLRAEDPMYPLEDKTVTVYRHVDPIELALMDEGASPLTTYLYPGNYCAQADHEGVTETLEFIMEDKPQDILWDFSLVPIDEEHFPNELLRTKMSDYDLDHDGYLTGFERGRVDNIAFYCLDISDQWPNIPPISMTGISYLYNLEWLTLATSGVETLDLSHNPKLKHLSVTCSLLTELDLSHNPELETLGIHYALLTGLDLSHNLKLKELAIGDWTAADGLTLDLTHNTALEEVNILNTVVDALDVSRCTNLAYLYVQWTFDHPAPARYSLPSLDLSNNRRLVNVDLAYCGMGSVNLSGYSSLETIYIDHCLLTSVNVSSCSSLVSVGIGDCPNLTSVSVGGSPKLANVGLVNSPRLGGVNLSGLYALGYVSIVGSGIQSLNLRHLEYCQVYCDYPQRVYFKECYLYWIEPGWSWIGSYGEEE